MAAAPRAVVVGGGITGCAIAYTLAREGAQVTVLEAEALGSKASGVAAGLLAPVGESDGPGPLTDLALASFRRFPDFAAEVQARSGIDPHLVRQPFLYPAFDDREAAELEARTRWTAQAAPDLRLRVVDIAEAQRIEPRLTPQAQAVLLSEDEAHVDAYRLVLALAAAAEGLGVTFRYVQVSGLRARSDRATALLHSGGEEPCDVAVLAMGPWTAEASAWLGVTLPVAPLRGQLLRLELPSPLGAVVFHHGGYLVSKPSGTTLAGTTEEWAGFAPWPTEEGQAQVLRHALRLAPSLADARVAGAVAGLRPVTPDRLPVLGRAPGWANVLVATGAGRNGVLLSPITGRLVADLALGRDPVVPLAPFDPARFDSGVAAG